MNHVHVDEEAVEITLTISSLQSGKNLLEPFKDYPIVKGLIDEEIPTTIMEHGSSSDDDDEQTRVEPNPNIYKPHVPQPQAYHHPRAKVSEPHKHLLDAFHKVSITIPLLDATKHIHFYAKIFKGICISHRSPKRIQLSEIVSSIMMNTLPIKKRHRGVITYTLYM